MKHFLPYILCLVHIFGFAQSNFNIDRIPKNIIENADAVIRIDETIFTVESVSKAHTQRHIAVTIFNERADERNEFQAFYDKFSKIKKLEGRLYDATGKMIEKLKNSDIKDIALSYFEDGVNDNRKKIAKFNKKNHSYPYTIEFDCLEETQNMMFYPRWNPMKNEHTGIQKSSFSIITPKPIAFRYKEVNISRESQIVEVGDNRIQTWVIENSEPYEDEFYSPPNIHPLVLTAPVEFEIEGYHGKIQTWSDLGKFYGTLNRNRNELPQNIKAKVKELTQEETSLLKKVQKLYEYLQANTRYMSIQLGIGGWQTIDSKEVANKGYGDCKALSNYMGALLKEANIISYQALVLAGNHASDIYTDFPSMDFNHIITCVPIEKDTIWLECTSQTISLGYQGDFTGNRQALLIMQDGGKLVNTVFYKPSENSQKRNAKVIIDDDGNAKALVITGYTGIREDMLSNVIHTMSTEEQKEWLLKSVTIPSFELLNFSFSENKARIPKGEEKLELKINKIISQSGSRLFITPNLMANFIEVPLVNGDRKAALFLSPNYFNFLETDSISYQLPINYEVEYLPDPIKIQTKFGEYSAKVSIINGNLIYFRNLKSYSGSFPSSDYQGWVDFFKKIKKSDQISVVFVKKKM